MNILGLSQVDSGCSYHRIVLPLGFMDNVKAYVTNMPQEEVLAEGWDIVFYNRLSCFDADWDKVKSDLQAKVIMDIDDDWILPSNHIAQAHYEIYKTRFENNIRKAELITCTNEKLANKIKAYNPNIEIFENALPFGSSQFAYSKTESEFTRIFWCGSITHEYDLRILENPIKRLDNKNVQMVIGGYNESNEMSKKTWTKMVNIFTNRMKLNHQVLHGLLPNQYMNLYKEADIMLIPLENSSWHACKSNLKILEAACNEIPCIVSKVEPYSRDKDAPVLWVEKQSDWLTHINYLLKNKNAIIDYGKKLKEWAESNYHIHSVNQRRRKAFADLIKS